MGSSRWAFSSSIFQIRHAAGGGVEEKLRFVVVTREGEEHAGREGL
jgi:hypothetical protein